MYERNQAQLGYVPNYAKAFSLRPQVMDSWAQLLKSIRSTMEHEALRARDSRRRPCAP